MPRAAAAGALALATCLTSPLGGLFLALAAATLLLVRQRDRLARAAHGSSRLWLALLVLLVLTAAGTVLLFPDVGEMPFRAGNFLPAAGCTVAVAALCPNPRIRVGALAYLVLELGFLTHPSAVGVNITRVAWLFTLPVVVAYARVPVRTLVAAATAALLLPAVDLVGQLRAATDASASAAFYPPLLRALATDAASRPGSLGQRVEVLDPRNHWPSAYLPARFPLARGWERQADRADNPLFYSGQRLDVASYRRWLDPLAVGWVAVRRGRSTTTNTGGTPRGEPPGVPHQGVGQPHLDPLPGGRRPAAGEPGNGGAAGPPGDHLPGRCGDPGGRGGALVAVPGRHRRGWHPSRVRRKQGRLIPTSRSPHRAVMC